MLNNCSIKTRQTLFPTIVIVSIELLLANLVIVLSKDFATVIDIHYTILSERAPVAVSNHFTIRINKAENVSDKHSFNRVVVFVACMTSSHNSLQLNIVFNIKSARYCAQM